MLFITRETYTCNHVSETRLGPYGPDNSITTEEIPVGSPCLACRCRVTLDTFFPPDDHKKDDDDDSKSSPTNSILIRELTDHLGLKVADTEQCATVDAEYKSDGDRKMVRYLKKLKGKILKPKDKGELRSALFDLSVFAEIGCTVFGTRKRKVD